MRVPKTIPLDDLHQKWMRDPEYRAEYELAIGPLTLVFAMPPSVNDLYRNVPGVGRVRSKRCKLWLAQAGWQLQSQPRLAFVGDVDLVFRFGPRKPNADVSNRIKAAEDLLVKHGIIEDDRYVVKVSAEWADDVNGCEVTISGRSQT